MDREKMDKGLDKLLTSMDIGGEGERHINALVDSIVEFTDGEVYGFKNHLFVWCFNPSQEQERQEVQTRLLAANADVVHEMNNRVQACRIPKKVDIELHPNKTVLDLLIQRVVYEIYAEDGIYSKMGTPIPSDPDQMTDEEQSDALSDRHMLAMYTHVHYRPTDQQWYMGFSLLRQKTERIGPEEYQIVETLELIGAEFVLY